MWQVVSGTANLLSDRALQAVAPTIQATVVVVVPGQAEPWHVANAAFRLLTDALRKSIRQARRTTARPSQAGRTATAYKRATAGAVTSGQGSAARAWQWFASPGGST